MTSRRPGSDVDTILLLAGVGFLLLLTEMFLPGGVLGALGSLMLVAAIIVGYVELGSLRGSLLLVVILVAVLVGFGVWMSVFPRTAIGRGMMLSRPPIDDDDLPAICTSGDEGIALTPLRPAGTARIGNRRVDVVTDGEYVEPDTAVVVTACEGSRVVVRKKA